MYLTFNKNLVSVIRSSYTKPLGRQKQKRIKTERGREKEKKVREKSVYVWRARTLSIVRERKIEVVGMAAKDPEYLGRKDCQFLFTYASLIRFAFHLKFN